MSDDGNRRASERVKVSMPVRYRYGDQPERTGTIDNISRTGLLLVAGETFPEDTVLTIVLEGAGQRHEITSRIVRSSAMGGFAVAFMEVGADALAYVREALGVP
ncbi:MAG TPA: PilZ domain-containing protein [Candidatus Sulfotelmatobacter sp.]|nr:PilZ domain-containing protein [Candidatus Sulfotelmatobacter sp.]